MGYGEEVNTSDFDSDIHGFDSHYPCLCQVFCIRWFESNKGCYVPADKTKSNSYNKCVDWDKTELKLGILSKWNISGCVYGLILNVLEVVHSKTKTTNTNKKGKKKYGKN